MNPISYLELCFYDPTHDNQGLVNKIVSFFDGPYCHVELFWPPTSEAVSMYMGSGVIIRKREFDEKRYTRLKIPCTIQQMTTAYLHAQYLQQQGTRFNVLALTPLAGFLPANKFSYCSKLVAEILTHANIVEIPTNVSPSHLYRILKDDKYENFKCQGGQCSAVLDFKV